MSDPNCDNDNIYRTKTVKTYKIGISETWSLSKTLTLEADSIEQAKKLAEQWLADAKIDGYDTVDRIEHDIEIME